MQYQVIPIPQWVRIFHTMFAKLRIVTSLQSITPLIGYNDMIRELFHLDMDSKMFQKAVLLTTVGSTQRQATKSSSPPRKRRKMLQTASVAPGNIQYPATAVKRAANQAKVVRPTLLGDHPCYHWICYRAPCFDAVHCAVVASPHRRGKPRPHSFDPLDKAVEADFRAWVLKFQTN